MKLLSLFSGIGAFEKALDNMKVPYELVGYCEIDKYASKSYAAIHGVDESMNLGDITKIDEKALPNDIDLITYGFPCQDISLAGKQKGLFNEDGTQTRSGLFFDALRIIEATKPKVAIAENVKNLTSKKFAEQFRIVLEALEEAGYNNYWKVLNAKDFGIPQNRERVFIVSIRKDVDQGYEFPTGIPLNLRLKDMLEDNVEEKFYLSNKMKQYLTTITEKNKARGNGNVYSPSNLEGVSKTITTKEGCRVKDNFIEEPLKMKLKDVLEDDVDEKFYLTEDQMGKIINWKAHQRPFERVLGNESISPTLTARGAGEYHSGMIIYSPDVDETSNLEIQVREATKKGYTEATVGDSINFEQPNSTTRRGRVGKQVAQTLTTSPQQGVVING